MKKGHSKDDPDWFSSDMIFNSVYPPHIREVAQKHWTPLEVAMKAADYLASSPGTKVLDIGSGSGKFCFTAANFHPDTQFYGVEQRKELVDLCNNLKENFKLANITFKGEILFGKLELVISAAAMIMETLTKNYLQRTQSEIPLK